jgi:uncharacterized protein (DUF1501 family)
LARRHQNCGNHGIPRRHFLFGTLGVAGAAILHGVPASAQSGSVVAKPRNSARSCIFINLAGAPSQLDTFDPKDGPWNPRDADIREHPGGIVLSRKFFPFLSDLTGDLCVLRSVSSWEAAHPRGQFYIQSGHSLNPAFAQIMPHIGAVVAYEKQNSGPLPPFFSFGGAGDEQRQGFLPGIATPFTFSPVPTGLNNLRHDFWGNQSQAFFDRSYSLLQSLDAPLRTQPLNNDMASYAAVLSQARQLVYNDAVVKVFQFSPQDDSRYGATVLGRSMVTARNLVQAKLGAAFVSITQSGWDLHSQQFNKQQSVNLYSLTNDLDRSLGNLIMDLKASGDLASTLIVVIGEFGRTPGPLNSRDGRDHFRPVMSALMIGGGVQGGRAIGVTDEISGAILEPGWRGDRAIYVQDITATIYSALGIDWTKSIDNALQGRRYIYIEGAAEGQYGPVEDVFA